jgi:hypothetical protein
MHLASFFLPFVFFWHTQSAALSALSQPTSRLLLEGGNVVYESGLTGAITRYDTLFINGRNIRDIHMPASLDPQTLLVNERRRMAAAASAYQRKPKIDTDTLLKQLVEQQASKPGGV